MNMKRQDEEQTPYMRTDPHFITSFQDFLNSGVYEELSMCVCVCVSSTLRAPKNVLHS